MCGHGLAYGSAAGRRWFSAVATRSQSTVNRPGGSPERPASPPVQEALVVLARALAGPVDLMVAAREENQRPRHRADRPTKRQDAADEDAMVAAIVRGIAFTLEMGQCTRNERHTGGTEHRLEARPLAAPRLGEAR